MALIGQQGKKLGQEKNLDLLPTDGPPGIACPVIASLGGATAEGKTIFEYDGDSVSAGAVKKIWEDLAPLLELRSN